MYKHILIPTDGSALSLKAVKTGARLAKRFKAKVTALYVIPPYRPCKGPRPSPTPSCIRPRSTPPTCAR